MEICADQVAAGFTNVLASITVALFSGYICSFTKGGMGHLLALSLLPTRLLPHSLTAMHSALLGKGLHSTWEQESQMFRISSTGMQVQLLAQEHSMCWNRLCMASECAAASPPCIQ